MYISTFVRGWRYHDSQIQTLYEIANKDRPTWISHQYFVGGNSSVLTKLRNEWGDGLVWND